MKATTWSILPLCCVVLICLYPVPFFAIQALPASVTQEGWLMDLSDGKGGKLEIVASNGVAQGLFRGTGSSTSLLWQVSLFAKEWYFVPIARVLRRAGWGPVFKYL